MVNLKEALAGLSTRPALYLALIVLLAGFGYHIIATYQSCRGHAELRDRLYAAIAASAGGSSPGPIRLSRITDFPWDRAEILVNYKPGGATTDCPFQWDWSREKRADLIARDLLTVIVFLEDGRLVDYLEFRRDRADFVAVNNPYTPETAVFDVAPSPEGAGAFILSAKP